MADLRTGIAAGGFYNVACGTPAETIADSSALLMFQCPTPLAVILLLYAVYFFTTLYFLVQITINGAKQMPGKSHATMPGKIVLFTTTKAVADAI